MSAPPQRLPVELAGLEATRDGKAVRLTWRTLSEQNNAGFYVERSAGSGAFEEIGFREGAGTISEVQRYAFTDETPPAFGQTLRYRLRQVDRDGRAAYSAIVEVALAVPQRFALEGNYPNPFRRQTKISFSLAEPVQVQLEVFDLLGRKVTTVVNEEMEARHHEVTWYGRDASGRALAPGVYLYRIRAGTFADTGRTVLVR